MYSVSKSATSARNAAVEMRSLVGSTVPVVTAKAVAEETSMWSRAVDSVFIMVFGS